MLKKKSRFPQKNIKLHTVFNIQYKIKMFYIEQQNSIISRGSHAENSALPPQELIIKYIKIENSYFK